MIDAALNLKEHGADSPSSPATLSSAAAPSPAFGESEREHAPLSDAIPTWQPGAMDPLSLFGVGNVVAPAPPPATSSPAALDPLVAELLRSIAWGGDRRRGTARIELGSGRYGGTTLKVDAVGDGLQIDLQAPPGVDAAALAARLAARFEARGLRVDSLTVR